MSTKIIAELSANHKHEIKIAKQSIKAAMESNADAIKIQTYTADTLTIDCDNEYFKISQGTIWDGKTLYELYKEAYTPWEWHNELFEYAKEIGIEIFSTPFDNTAVDFLEELKVPIYKIASFEITDIPLIKYVASKQKPIILSTGISKFEEIEEAIMTIRNQGNNEITVLQCTSQYPAKVEEANLITMVDIREKFNVKVGLSDHTIGSDAAVVATALGASVIEKHFIIDRNIGGPDATFSMQPMEFKEMVERIRKTEQIMGEVTYKIDENKAKSRIFSRSLFIVKDVKAGQVATLENVRSIRPAYGISPKYMDEILGKKFKKDFMRGVPLSWDMITN